MNPAALIDKAMRLRAETKRDTLDYDLLVTTDLDRDDVARLWISLGEWKTALNAVERAVGHQLVQLLDGSSIEVDEYVVYSKLGDTKETVTDEEGFWQALLTNPGAIPRYFNPNYAKKGSLPPAVRDTFFQKSREVKPDAVPAPAAVPVQVLEDNKQKRALR